MASKWGVLGWLLQPNSTPIIDIYNQASTHMVDYFLSTMFHAQTCQRNYLRIQAENLTGDSSLVDIATKDNLKDLVGIGEGNSEPALCGGTNKDALIRFAKMLSDEHKFRLSKSQHKN
ncbi:patatin-like protein 3 [Salvia splendens]|uniref:patatin-like protein 3 n=1 Tax=Salvia splendens TaxID=180675 RepID=UPI001C25924C|nr:patatin-like protein 3 [Salvia splendens]